MDMNINCVIDGDQSDFNSSVKIGGGGGGMSSRGAACCVCACWPAEPDEFEGAVAAGIQNQAIYRLATAWVFLPHTKKPEQPGF